VRGDLEDVPGTGGSPALCVVSLSCRGSVSLRPLVTLACTVPRSGVSAITCVRVVPYCTSIIDIVSYLVSIAVRPAMNPCRFIHSIDRSIEYSIAIGDVDVTPVTSPRPTFRLELTKTIELTRQWRDGSWPWPCCVVCDVSRSVCRLRVLSVHASPLREFSSPRTGRPQSLLKALRGFWRSDSTPPWSRRSPPCRLSCHLQHRAWT
jgi:hypothetical protein